MARRRLRARAVPGTGAAHPACRRCISGCRAAHLRRTRPAVRPDRQPLDAEWRRGGRPRRDLRRADRPDRGRAPRGAQSRSRVRSARSRPPRRAAAAAARRQYPSRCAGRRDRPRGARRPGYCDPGPVRARRRCRCRCGCRCRCHLRPARGRPDAGADRAHARSPGVRHPHVRIDRPAQGRRGRAPRARELPAMGGGHLPPVRRVRRLLVAVLRRDRHLVVHAAAVRW